MAGTIDDVIARLEAIVAENRARGDRAGFFAAMYLSVTREIKKAIGAGVFDDGPRMAEFDAVFAHRYIDAYDTYRSGAEPTLAWRVSFDASDKRRPIIVQQLLTGMNAHINLDLGVAAATIAPGAAIGDLKPDFDRINAVLAGMTAGFMRDVEAVSPWIKILDRIGGRSERTIVKFSIDIARDEAWKLATELAPVAPERWGPQIDVRDRVAADLGRLVLHPGWLMSSALTCIRARESNDVVEVIDLLCKAEPALPGSLR